MRDSRTASRKIALCAMLMALAMIFSYVETMIPINFGIPGVKLGLANLVIVAAIYLFGGKQAFLITAAFPVRQITTVQSHLDSYMTRNEECS